MNVTFRRSNASATTITTTICHGDPRRIQQWNEKLVLILLFFF